MTQQATGRPAESPVVREVECKTLLNRGKGGGYSMNCYRGCAHGCVYCYARFMQRFHPHPEPWGRFVDVKVNAVEALRKQLRRAEPGGVFTSSACDAWQPLEREWELTRECCRLLTEAGFTVNALTKSPLLLRDLDVLDPELSRIGVTITTFREEVARLWEPRVVAPQARLRVLEEAKRRGYRTSVMFGPLLPWLSDDEESLTEMFRRAAEAEVDVIWVDALNRRPRVWPAVGKLLRGEFPDLHDRYSRMLHHKPSRQEYLEGLRERVGAAAEEAGVDDRLVGCP
jgi:DNA repair photolyase